MHTGPTQGPARAPLRPRPPGVAILQHKIATATRVHVQRHFQVFVCAWCASYVHSRVFVTSHVSYARSARTTPCLLILCPLCYLPLRLMQLRVRDRSLYVRAERDEGRWVYAVKRSGCVVGHV